MGNWDNEKQPTKALYPEGWQNLLIHYGEKQLSKKGNEMYKITFKLSGNPGGEFSDMYFILTAGKRWALKSLLEAAGVEKQEDYGYDYLPELIGKSVDSLIVHEDNKYINREGDEVVTKQHRIVEFKAGTTGNPDGVSKAEEIKWDN